jgi:3-methyladenine DNA glycosylase AlkC
MGHTKPNAAVYGWLPLTVPVDIVTAPFQAPAYIASESDKASANQRAKADAAEYKRLMPLLENDPTIALTERWDLKKDMHVRVFMDSFSNPKVKYTDDLLEEIHRTCPSVSDCVFRSRSCSKEFLVRHFDEEFERSTNSANQNGLVNIVSNPNTPFELVYKVITVRGPAGGAAYQALDRRASEAKDFLMPMLEHDPNVALSERWDRKSIQHRNVFKESFSNPKVKYTDDLLEEIRQTCPDVRDYVFRSESCSKDFLVKHFDEEYALSSKWSYQHGLEDIIANLNTPIELVEKVASSHDFDSIIGNHGNIAQQAQMVLAKRRSE